MNGAARVGSLFAVLATAALTASASASQWVWTESYAAQRVLATVRVPCADVPITGMPHPCNLQMAIAADTYAKKQQQVCSTDPAYEIQHCAAELASYEILHSAGQEPFIEHGYPLGYATCIGSGTPDKSGARFSAFRCKIEVTRSQGDTAPADWLAQGTITVTTTSRTAFHWALLG
jgi:hypothetical protein